MATTLIAAVAVGLAVAVLFLRRHLRARAERRYDAVLRRLEEQLEPISKTLEHAVERSEVARAKGVADDDLAPNIESLLAEIAAEGAAVRAFRHVAKGIAPVHADPRDESDGRYEAELERKIAGARRTGRPLALVLLDLDPPSDPASELRLAELATLLEGVTRETDTVCRRRSDELGVLLPETTVEGAHGFHRRVRQEVARRGFGETGALTFSAGIVEWQPHETGSAFDARARATVRRAADGPLEAVD